MHFFDPLQMLTTVYSNTVCGCFLSAQCSAKQRPILLFIIGHGNESFYSVKVREFDLV